jgi:beta-lactam-binding protein with PASTA domain
MDDTLADSLAGRLLDGRYAVTARIAHGGMATVYVATDTRLDRQVALKVMHAELARDDDFVRRFVGEAKSVARLSHPNVVAVFDQGADGPLLYLTMEYVPGRTLKDMLRERGRFSPAAALDIMSGVLDGLAAAHSSGITHRDVKPENVLLTADGRIKVADFGLARAHWAAGHTQAGLLIGTVAYLPPEQVMGGTTGPRGDVYSAGVMLYELLTGRQPFTGDNPLSIAYQHVNSDVPAPSTLAPGIPAAVDQLVLAATSRDPALRPADAGEFARAVRRVREGLGTPGGLTGMMGVGVQGLAEAPWLDLQSQAATNGWWARDSSALPAVADDTGPPGADKWWEPGATPAPPAAKPGTGPFAMGPASGQQFGGGQFGTGQFGNGQFGAGQFGAGQFGAGQFGAGQLGNGGGDGAASHTLVVRRGDDGRYPGSREPFLQRWLFSPRLAVIALILVLGVGLGVGGWWLTTGRYAQVPSVTGDSVAAATAALKANGFTAGGETPVHSNVVQQGTVVGTNPAGRAAKGSAVSLLVSAGPFTSIVPVVKNDTLAQAQAALARAHLTGREQKVGSSAPVGTVLGTNPVAGTSWPQTKPVAILVAASPPLPNFFGMNVQAAEQWASAHGVNLLTPQTSSSTAAQGTIVGQQPAAGSAYHQGETVTVDVSSGPAEVPIPDPIGLTVAAATNLLEQAGFQVSVDRMTMFGNRVIDYDPSTSAPRGSTITLIVSQAGGF